MASYSFKVNGKEVTVEAEPDMPILWVLRDLLDLTGTKYGCGVNTCGACTILINNRSVRACQTPVRACSGQDLTTIEGLGKDALHPIQEAWEKFSVPQCGYCQSGQMMAFAGLLSQVKKPTKDQVNSVMSQNLCRCGTYHRIEKAIDHVLSNLPA